MKNKRWQDKAIFQMKNKRGQFYLVATIIIVGLVVALSVAINYSTKTNYSDVEEIAKELTIESQYVLDHDTYNTENEFDNFGMVYSEYAGDDKSIYYIIVDENEGTEEAYKYSGGNKVDLSENLDVNQDIQYTLDSRVYHFKLEYGKNFYFIVAQDRGGERYVVTG